MWELCLVLMRRIRQASELVEELSFYPVDGRLARWMLNQFEENPNAPIARDKTLDEMAAKIGTTPVMVSKILSRFTAGGFIEVSRTEFELSNQEGLRKIASAK